MSSFETLIREMRKGFRAMGEVSRRGVGALAAQLRGDALGSLYASLYRPTVDLLSKPTAPLWRHPELESGILASASLEEGDWAMLVLLRGEGSTELWYTFPTPAGWKVRRIRFPGEAPQVAHLLALAADAVDAPAIPDLLRLMGLGEAAAAVEAAAAHLSALDAAEREALVRAVMLSWDNPAPAVAGVCGGHGWWLADLEDENGLALFTIVEGVRMGWLWCPDPGRAEAAKEKLLLVDAPEEALEPPLQLCEGWLRVLSEAARAALAQL